MKMLLHKDRYGFSLTEVMVAMVIGLILLGAVTTSYIAQNRSFVAQDSVSEVNTQSKIAHDMIANDIKGAGFGAPDDMNMDPVNSRTDTITPVDNSTTFDAITVVGGYRMIGTAWPSGVTVGGTCPDQIDIAATTFDISLNGTDTPNITDMSYLTIDGIQYFNVTTAGSGGSVTVDPPFPLSVPLVDTNGDNLCDQGRPVYLVEDVTYCVAADLSLHRIWRNADASTCTPSATSTDEIIAENIEDLQLAYALDTDGDGQLDDLDSDGEADYYNGAAVADPSTIRAIRINILARSDFPDPNYANQGNPPAQIENRILGATNDNFRRRWWRTVVKVRNQ
jgi:prepilin-type N-terminal cleavage/methylation domain-containing protein